MNDLYMLAAGAVIHVGPMSDVEHVDDHRDLPRVVSAAVPANGPAHAALHALLSSGEPAAFCWGQEDGTAAPTASGNAQQFTCPTTRTYFRFFALVRDIGQRNTDTGPQTLIQLDLKAGQSGIPMSFKGA